MNDINKKGLSTTLLCCLIWGLLPLYWALLNQVSSFSVLSHRIIWSGVWMIFIILAMGRQQLRIDIQQLGVSIMTYELGSLPTVSIALAVTFSLYGAVKKRLTIHPFSSIALEAWLVTPIALWYLATIDTSSWVFLENVTSTGLLLIGAGLTTSIPLILFSYGAKLLPLNVLGFLQYLSPTMGFFLAIFYFGESFGTAQLIAFGCIWVALVLFSLSNRITTIRKI